MRGSSRARPLQSLSSRPRPALTASLLSPARPRRALVHCSAVLAAKKPFKLSDIGEGINEVEIIQWRVAGPFVKSDQRRFVKPSAEVTEFDPIVEVSSDKATVEITSPFSGRILDTLGEVGQIVRVGDVICNIDVAEELVEGEDAVSSAAPDSQPASSPDAATLPTQVAAKTPTQSSSSSAPVAAPSEAPSRGTGKLAGPATRFLARQHGIDIGQLDGTGPGGRVTKSDVMAAMSSRDELAPEPSASTSAPTPPSTPAPAGQVERIPLEAHRKNMFKAMTASQSVVPFVYSDEIDVTEMERMRALINANVPARYRDQLPKGITLLPLLLKALSRAMAEHPLFASSLVDGGKPDAALLRRPTHDISIALSAPDTNALYTPLLNSVDTASPFELAVRIAALQKTPGFRFAPATLKPGTVTLSNVGVVGGTYTAPVIPPTGQLAIGAIGRTRAVPTYPADVQALARAAALGGGPAPVPVPRLMLATSWTADHRIVAGVELAQFVASWKRHVEQPALLIGLGA